MTEYNLALFFHLLGAFSLIAGTIVAGVAFEAARRRRHPAEIALLLGLTRIGVVLVGIGTVLVLGFGLWLVELGVFVLVVRRAVQQLALARSRPVRAGTG